MGQARLLYHTLRHLRPGQVSNRVARRLRRPRLDASPAPGLRPATGPWVTPIARAQSLFDDGTALFLNRRARVDGAAAWNDPTQAKLWLYNLHYFDDLTRPGDAAFQAGMIARWIAENPAPQGNGWEPYPTSLRIVNWIKWVRNGNAPSASMLDSLAVQVRWLSATIEWHLLGNHLMANAKALFLAGLFFDGPEAEEWLAEARAILGRELPEQILPDGGHFELSPMYHAIILEDLCDLWNMARAYGRTEIGGLLALPERIAAMRRWLTAMTHPDGRIGFFNDTAFGIAPEPGEIEGYAEALGLGAVERPAGPLTHLADSGYVRVEQGEVVALLDVAAVGPAYLPGHAHADTLSFELSVGGERVVVNGGTSTYAPGPERLAERATRAHNTVEVAGLSSSEVWAAFRVARRAQVRDVTVEARGEVLSIAASHDGYRRLAGRPVHARVWNFAPGELRIEDSVAPAVEAVGRFRLAPGVLAEFDPGTTEARLAVGGAALALDFSAPPRLVPSAWHPEFGLSEATQSFELPLVAGKSLIRIKML